MIPGIYRMTPRRFRKAIEAGVFGESHVELLGGIPFVMSENPPHILASSRVHSTLISLAPRRGGSSTKTTDSSLASGCRSLIRWCSRGLIRSMELG